MNEIRKNTEQYLRRTQHFYENFRSFYELDLNSLGSQNKKRKMYHILPGYEKLPHNFMASVIVKFVFFEDETTVYKIQKHYWEKISINDLMTYLNERLPPHDAKLRTKRDNKPRINYIIE